MLKKQMKFKKIVKNTFSIAIVGVVVAPLTACDLWNLEKKSAKKTNNINNPTNPSNPTQPNNPQNPNVKPKPIPNVNVTKPSFASLGIKGISGTATMSTPPQPNSNLRVVISKKTNIANKEKITITYYNAISGGTVNGKSKEVFTYIVTGLTEPQSKTDIKVSRPNINISGLNGSGTFTLPSFGPNVSVTTTAQNGQLSNGNIFSITVTGKNTPAMMYTINGKPHETWNYTVNNLKNPIIDLNIQKPTLQYTGFDGTGWFDMPSFPNTTISTTAKNGQLSNGDQFTITVTANRGYTINGQSQEVWNYTAAGIPVKTKPKPAPNVTIKPKKVGYDFNQVKVEEVTEVNGQKTVIGYFGNNYKKSPVVFASGYIDLDMKNKPSGDVPFIKKSEMKKFMEMYFKLIVHGPEFSTIGLISIDNKGLNKKGAGGWANDGGLVSNAAHIKYGPENKSKVLITVNAQQNTNVLNSVGKRVDYNSLDDKFAALYETFQHEYGHTVNYIQGIQAPQFITRDKFRNGFVVAGIENGYTPNNGQNGMANRYYLSKKLLTTLASAMGIDTTLPNMQATVLTTLLSQKQTLAKNGQSTADIDKQIGLFFFRILAGTRDDVTTPLPNGVQGHTGIIRQLPGLMDRNKALLWPGKIAPDKFQITYYWPLGALGFSQLGGINGYSMGFHEMMARLLVLVTTKNNWWNNPETLTSLIAGYNPFYKYNNDAFNFSDNDDGGGTGNGFDKGHSSPNELIIKTGYGKGGIIDNRNQSKTTLHGLNQIKNITNMLIDNLDVNKRDRLVNFYKDTMFGYGKALSLFQKVDKNHATFNGFDYPTDKISMNVFGGWTKQRHQYLIFNDSSTALQVQNSNSIAFPIGTTHEVMEFRNNGIENFKTRSNKLTSYKGWYADWSDSLKSTGNTLNQLQNKTMYFWDDKNNDQIIETNEVTTIPWTSARVLYDQAEKIYSGSEVSQSFRAQYPGIGEILTSSNFDIYEYYTLSRNRNGFIKMEHDAP